MPESQGQRCRVLLLTNKRLTVRPGGAPIRYAGLAAGIGREARFTQFDLGCPNPGHCAHPSGVVTTDDGDLADPYPHIFCPATAEELLRDIRRGEPDVVVVSGLELWRYLVHVQDNTTCAVVMDLHNVESQLSVDTSSIARSRPEYSSLIGTHGQAVRSVERRMVEAADRVWTCTAPDRDLLVRLHGISPDEVTVVPNAIPVPATAPPPPARIDHALFVGSLDWFPNTQAVDVLLDEVAPLLHRDRGRPFPITIAGARPLPSVRNRRFPPGARFVMNPPSVTALWRNAVLAVPLAIGGGSRLKILEAFAAGSPVVSSAKGIEGIDAEHGRHYLLADSAAETAEAIQRVAGDPALRADLVRHGYRLLAENYGPPHVGDAVRDDLSGLSNGHR